MNSTREPMPLDTVAAEAPATAPATGVVAALEPVTGETLTAKIIGYIPRFTTLRE
jgi:hypothetical protein